MPKNHARRSAVRADRSSQHRRSSLPGSFRRQQAPQSWIVRWRFVQRFVEALKGLLIQQKEPLVQKDRGRFTAGRVEHEFRTVLPHRLGRAIDQRSLALVGPKIDRHPAAGTACLWHRPFLVYSTSIQRCIHIVNTSKRLVIFSLKRAVHSSTGERISLQQRPRLPNLLLACLLCRHAFVVRRTVDGHLASVGASEHAYERCGYVAVGVNEPAAVAAFPHTQAVDAEPSDVLGGRRREAKGPEGRLGVPKRR